MNPSLPLIPRKLFFGNPPQVVPQISPDGMSLAFLAPRDDVLNIWIAPTTSPQQSLPLTAERGSGIRDYGWLRSGEGLWFLKDDDGNENHHLNVVTLDGTCRDLTPWPRVQARVIGFSDAHPNEALIGINRRDPRWHDVYRMNLRDGTHSLVQENQDLAQYLCDDDLRLRVALRNTSDGGRELLVPNAEGAWSLLQCIPMDEVLTTQPVAVAKDESGEISLYLLDSRGRDKTAAMALNLSTGASMLLGEDAQADVLAVSLNPHSKRPEAFRTDYLQPQWQVIDAAVEADYSRIRQAHPGDFRILSRSGDDRLWVLSFSHDRQPGSYQLYDRQTGELSPLFLARPDLEGLQLATMRSQPIPTSDGLTLVCYLSLPPNIALNMSGSPLQPLPTVLLVHGGPWSRDHFQYSPEHQFLANRGYAVLSVNFRGSTGFGKDFVNAANLQWGARMQEDLQESVAWAVARGIADPNRVAIMGGSYGGYATLVGLSFTPTLFACGIDIVGPSNLETLLASFPPYWAPLLENFARRVGDPRTEGGRALLRERSPLHRAAAICRPLLIAQGANDVRVTRAESDQLVEAMQDKGLPVCYALYPDEGHGLGRPANKLSFMALVEHFLSRHLGGRSQPIGKDLEAGSLQLLAGREYFAAPSSLD